jgi:hypothetical protein
MAFARIIDPFKITEQRGLEPRQLAIIVGLINTGEYAGHFKRVCAKGIIYSARIERRCRLVFAEHEETTLFLIKSFNAGQHSQYECYLRDANAAYKQSMARA